MEEYFTEIAKIPRRDNMKLYGELLQKFLDSKLKIAKVDSKIFVNRNAVYLSNCLHRYVKIHDIPVKIHVVSGTLYVERI
jgi:hypothetical protein